jgi:hypothetical protein
VGTLNSYIPCRVILGAVLNMFLRKPGGKEKAKAKSFFGSSAFSSNTGSASCCSKYNFLNYEKRGCFKSMD